MAFGTQIIAHRWQVFLPHQTCLLRLKRVWHWIVMCAVCAHQEISTLTLCWHPSFVLRFHVSFLLYSVKKAYFQLVICHPLTIIEFWYEGNYSSLKLFAVIWNINEFFWVREEMNIWSQRSSITPGVDPLTLPSIPWSSFKKIQTWRMMHKRIFYIWGPNLNNLISFESILHFFWQCFVPFGAKVSFRWCYVYFWLLCWWNRPELLPWHFPLFVSI